MESSLDFSKLNKFNELKEEHPENINFIDLAFFGFHLSKYKF